MKKLMVLFVLVSAGFYAAPTIAQESEDTLVASTDKYKVVKNDGTVYIGYLLKNDAREILLRTDELGEIYIPKHEVKSLEKYNQEEELIKEKDASRNLLSSRYIQTTNGLPVKKGEGYAKFMLVGVDFQFALTDNWSMGGMASWSGIPLVITSKYSFKLADRLHTSVGILYGNLLYGSGLFSSGSNFSSGGGIVFGNFTYGDEEANINISGGYGFTHFQKSLQTITGYDIYGNPTITSEQRMDVQGTALFSIAAMKRISKQAMLVFDSVINFNDFTNLFVFSPAIRYMPKPENIWQFGLGMGVFDGQLFPIPLPMLSFHKVFK